MSVERKYRLLNKHRDKIPPGAVYIGRGSKWGNPFVIGRDGNRQEVVEKYAIWICGQPGLLATIPELDGKDLVCFCSPALCHGNVLMILVEEWRLTNHDSVIRYS